MDVEQAGGREAGPLLRCMELYASLVQHGVGNPDQTAERDFLDGYAVETE